MIVRRTRTYAVCPSCGKDASTVDHLLGTDVRTQWYCDTCGKQYSLAFSRDGSVEIAPATGTLVKTLDLLVLPPQKEPVYFIVEGMRFEHREGDKRFFYESHSCPTNWLRPEVVYHNGDGDPHGLIKFVASRDVSSLPVANEPVSPNAYDDALLAFIEEHA